MLGDQTEAQGQAQGQRTMVYLKDGHVTHEIMYPGRPWGQSRREDPLASSDRQVCGPFRSL